MNGEDGIDLGHHDAFRSRTVPVDLKKGRNTIVLKLSNTVGSNYGGWAFAFRGTLADGRVLLPRAEQPKATAE